MSTAQTLLFPFDLDGHVQEAVEEASARVNSICTLCGGSGWRYVAGGRVTRCECRTRCIALPKTKHHHRRRQLRVIAPSTRRDYKSAAAGER